MGLVDKRLVAGFYANLDVETKKLPEKAKLPGYYFRQPQGNDTRRSDGRWHQHGGRMMIEAGI